MRTCARSIASWTRGGTSDDRNGGVRESSHEPRTGGLAGAGADRAGFAGAPRAGDVIVLAAVLGLLAISYFPVLDAPFAPFTAKRQRAFDVVAGTIVIRCAPAGVVYLSPAAPGCSPGVVRRTTSGIQ